MDKTIDTHSQLLEIFSCSKQDPKLLHLRGESASSLLDLLQASSLVLRHKWGRLQAAMSLQSSLSILLNPAEQSLISLKEILPNTLNWGSLHHTEFFQAGKRAARSFKDFNIPFLSFPAFPPTPIG